MSQVTNTTAIATTVASKSTTAEKTFKSFDNLAQLSTDVEAFYSKSNDLGDKISNYIDTSSLSSDMKEKFEVLIDTLDEFEYEEDADDNITFEKVEEFNAMFKKVRNSFNKLRNSVFQQSRRNAEKAAAISAYEYLEQLEVTVNEKDDKGNFLRPRDTEYSIFRAFAYITYNPTPHHDGSGRMFQHKPETKTFFRLSAAERAIKSDPFNNINTFEITDEWTLASRAWETCRKANRLVVTEGMMETLESMEVIKHLEAGYEMYKSYRGAKNKSTSKQA